MKILGVGLSKTGTKSLTKALKILGYRAIHNDQKRLNPVLLGQDDDPEFRIYDDVDAVTDLPSAYFFRELLLAYPSAKAILTVRNTDSWLQSYRRHIGPNKLRPLKRAQIYLGSVIGIPKFRKKNENYPYKIAMRNAVYGTHKFREDLLRTKFEGHNAAVRQEIPVDRLLVMNIIEGDGWEKLCPFLGVDRPDIGFPHK